MLSMVIACVRALRTQLTTTMSVSGSSFKVLHLIHGRTAGARAARLHVLYPPELSQVSSPLG